MKWLTNIVAHKLFALAMLVGVGIWFLIAPAVSGNLGANPLEKLLHQTGEIAIWTLGAVLSLTPLRVLFPARALVVALNRHRRAIGVTACVYGLLHFGFHILYEGGWDGLVRSLTKPFIWFGLAGLSILIVLTLTSNLWSIRSLGTKNWKRLHRFAYLAAALLIYHQSIAGKGHWHTARWLLFPLLGLQLARIVKTLYIDGFFQNWHTLGRKRSGPDQAINRRYYVWPQSEAGAISAERRPSSASNRAMSLAMNGRSAGINRAELALPQRTFVVPRVWLRR
jgi:sulfoxide reductase heme-binding subunit YedZ